MSKVFLDLSKDANLREELAEVAAAHPSLYRVFDILEAGVLSSDDSSNQPFENIALRAQFEHGARSILRQLRVLMAPMKSKDELAPDPVSWGALRPD